MSKLMLCIGQRIRNYRIQRNMSQEVLAEKSGLHPTYIGQVERGEKNATIESISKIAAGLSLPLSVLFENIDESYNNVPTYPAIAYDMLQSVPDSVQKRLITILKSIVEIMDMSDK